MRSRKRATIAVIDIVSYAIAKLKQTKFVTMDDHCVFCCKL